MPKICQMASLNNTVLDNSKNEGQKNYPQTLQKGDYGPLKLKYITFSLTNEALSVMQRRFFYFHSPCYTVILCNFIGIAFRHWCSPVNLLHILRTSFLRTTLKGCFWLFFYSFSYIHSTQEFVFLKPKSMSKLCKIYV